MGNYTLELKGSLENPPVGVGPRIITGQVSLATNWQAVHASDLDLRTINSFVAIGQIGTLFSVKLNAPGSIGYAGNYASVMMERLTTVSIGTTPTRALQGTHVRAGTQTFRFIAEGE